MKILLALLSALFLVLGTLVLLLALGHLDEDLDAETSNRCVTAPPADGAAVVQTCTGTDEGGGQTTLVGLGGSALVTGGLLAVASTSVRSREKLGYRPPPAAYGGPGR